MSEVPRIRNQQKNRLPSFYAWSDGSYNRQPDPLQSLPKPQIFEWKSSVQPQSQNARETGERRQMGALAVVVKDLQTPQPKILLVQDTSKPEAATGITSWAAGGRKTFSLPGGGRGLNEDGSQETLKQTILNEMDEEVGVRLPDETAWLIQTLPFVVAQLGKDKINEFAVVSVLIDAKELTLAVSKGIEEKVNSGTARWFDLSALASLYQLITQVGEQDRHLVNAFSIRPQTLVAAYMWHLELCQKNSSEEIHSIIEPKNKALHTVIYQAAAQQNISVNNGTFEPETGAFSPHLSLADKAFLFRPEATPAN
jgi:ADP-ribose pyrophosphatase YjhB (NUDIX family)